MDNEILSTEEKQLGVELVEKTIKTLYELTDEVVKDLKDGKIQLGELIGLSDNAFAVFSIVNKFGQIKAEILDIDSAEIQQITGYVISLGFLSEDATIIISNAVQAIEKMIGAYQENIVPIIDLIKEKRAAK